MENLPEPIKPTRYFDPTDSSGAFNKAIRAYANTPFVRALIQAIPYVGGSLDTILYEKGSNWKEERITYFINDFSMKMNEFIRLSGEKSHQVESKIDSEDFHDLFLETLKSITTTKEKDKIKLFSNILLSHIEFSDRENAANIYLQILDSMSLSEVVLLKKIQNLKNKMSVYEIEGKQFFWEELKKYIESKRIQFNVRDYFPETCSLSEIQVYLITKMKNMLITEIIDYSTHTTLSYTISNSSQSTTYQVKGNQIDYSITRFGCGFIDWIKLNGFAEN